jgi:hypothetical protein
MRQESSCAENNAQLAASSRFGKYKKEEKTILRKTDIKEDPKIVELKLLWNSFWENNFGIPSMHGQDEDKWHNAMLKHISSKGSDYSAADITKFSLVLENLRSADISLCAGLFLSALINHGKDLDYLIRTVNIRFDKLGFRNKKNIEVIGDLGCAPGMLNEGSIHIKGSVGKNLADKMVGGTIIVEQNAGECAGPSNDGGAIIIKGNSGAGAGLLMCGGSLTIEGDIVLVYQDWNSMLGFDMYGGIITVKGNVGTKVGDRMKGGEIHIGGDMESIGDVEHGKIYHKGILIVDK